MEIAEPGPGLDKQRLGEGVRGPGAGAGARLVSGRGTLGRWAASCSGAAGSGADSLGCLAWSPASSAEVSGCGSTGNTRLSTHERTVTPSTACRLAGGSAAATLREEVEHRDEIEQEMVETDTGEGEEAELVRKVNLVGGGEPVVAALGSSFRF